MKAGDLLIIQCVQGLSTFKKGERCTFIQEVRQYWKVRRHTTGNTCTLYGWRFRPDILTEEEFDRINNLNKP
mgnify:FL=1